MDVFDLAVQPGAEEVVSMDGSTSTVAVPASGTMVALSIFAIFISALTGTLVPILFTQVSIRLTRMGNAFASGFLTSAAIVHLMPSAHESMQRVLPHATFPYDGAATLAGAVVVYLIDVFLRSRVNRKQHDHGHAHADASHSTLPNVVPTSYATLPLLDRDKASSVVAETDPAFIDHAPHARGISMASALMATLSVHSLMEGVTLGASKGHTAQFTVLLTAILCHKLFAALTLGLTLAAVARESHNSRRSMQLAILAALVFSSLTPIGAVLASVATTVSTSAQSPVAMAVIQCVCAGVFLYVACVDLLADEVRLCSCDPQDALLRAVIFTSAASAMTALAIWV